MKARIITAIASFFVFLFCATAQAARDDVLIIVNDNSIDSPQVGAYYAQQRSIAAANIVHVKVPNQYYIDWAQFLSLRDQILRFGICPSVPSATRPAACSDTSIPIYTATNVENLTALTKIRYIVTTRGVPTRMTVDGSTLLDPLSSTSVDNYLRFWLARYIQSDEALTFGERSTAFGDGRGMRIVNPPIDKEYIIGRIDGVDLASAKALVDRAIRVEANGLYGKLYGSTFGSTGGESKWTNYATNQPIYLPADNTQNYWRYTFGLFGESRPECSNYTSNYLSYSESIPNGKTPAYCLAQFNLGTPNDAAPGLANSRQPIALDAMAYFGSLDGQGIVGGFSTLLNWRKNNSCTVTRCDDAADPTACRFASADPFKEINTACVGVADGFIGYNFISYPVSILGIWPTGWGPQDIDRNDVPTIKSTDGQNGTYSVWFSQPDDGLNPSCYAYNKVNNTLGSSSLCPSRQWLGLRQAIPVPNPLTPSSHRFSFYLKGEASAISTTISSRLQSSYYIDPANSAPQPCPTTDPHYTLDSAGTCIYTDVANHQISSNWVQYSRDITTPVLSGWKNTQLQVVFGNNQLPQGGGIGLDTISLKNLSNPTNPELIVNGAFDQGHKQAAMGDFAASFLSRLGGTAFWGSLSHHQSNGHSFDKTSLGTLVYFVKGLPLGDAVWLGEQNNSGIFYGDPLYSPASIKFSYLQGNPGSFIGSITLYGDTINGRDLTKVNTTYSIDYCQVMDFYSCDQQYLWRPTGISGIGGQSNQSLGTWNASSLANGNYLLRLNVNSKNLLSGKAQSFFDYLPVKKRDAVISGTIRDSTGQALARVSLAISDNYGFGSSATTDNDGYYAGSVPKNGTYLVYPTKSGHTIRAVSGNVFQNISNQDVKDKDFLATATNYFISGTIKDQNGQPVPGVPVSINDNFKFTSTSNTNSKGYFAQGGLKDGVYLVYPMLAGYTFKPLSGTLFQSISGASVSGKDILGTKAGFSISGTIKTVTGLPILGVEVAINNNSGYSGKALTDANGYYTWGGLANDLYLIYPTFNGCTFQATNGTQFASINGVNITNKDFTGTCTS